MGFLKRLFNRQDDTPTFERGELVEQLADQLAQVKYEDGQWGFVVLEVEQTPFYVQFTSFPGPGMRAEAVGNGYLPTPLQLDEAGAGRMRTLGWRSPDESDDDKSAGNWFQELRPSSLEDLPTVADLALLTLEDGYRATSEGPLHFWLDYWSDDDVANQAAAESSGPPASEP